MIENLFGGNTAEKALLYLAAMGEGGEWLPLLSTLRTKRREDVVIFGGYYNQLNLGKRIVN